MPRAAAQPQARGGSLNSGRARRQLLGRGPRRSLARHWWGQARSSSRDGGETGIGNGIGLHPGGEGCPRHGPGSSSAAIACAVTVGCWWRGIGKGPTTRRDHDRPLPGPRSASGSVDGEDYGLCRLPTKSAFRTFGAAGLLRAREGRRRLQLLGTKVRDRGQARGHRPILVQALAHDGIRSGTPVMISCSIVALGRRGQPRRPCGGRARFAAV